MESLCILIRRLIEYKMYPLYIKRNSTEGAANSIMLMFIHSIKDWSMMEWRGWWWAMEWREER